jgi:hypothetical protein
MRNAPPDPREWSAMVSGNEWLQEKNAGGARASKARRIELLAKGCGR